MDQRILLIEGVPADAETIRSALAQANDRAFSGEWVPHSSAGVEQLNTRQVDAVLLDLFLPDCQGLETFDQLWRVAPDVPILIVCDPGDESLAVDTLAGGAHAHLLRPDIDRHAPR